MVLVPFYRGAVVFDIGASGMMKKDSSRPLLSRSGCISSAKVTIDSTKVDSSRPLLSRSGCICIFRENNDLEDNVLVPFYRGAVVFYSSH